MTLPKKLLFYGVLAVLILVVVEGMSQLAYFLALDRCFGGVPAAGEAAPGTSPPRGKYFLGGQHWKHPFYGYTPSPDLYGEGDLNLYPPPTEYDDTVVIALFGGSVAQNVALPSLRYALEQHFAANGLPRRPVLINLAWIAMKQPQQASAAANILAWGGHFDILVNLDGHNEINLAEPEHDTLESIEVAAFPFLPFGWENAVDLTVGETLLAGEIAVRREEQGELRDAIASSPFRCMAAFALLYHYRLERTNNQIIQLNHALDEAQSGYSLEKKGPHYPFQWYSEGMYRDKAQSWYRGSLLMAELAELAGAEYYHFQQPSQYVPGAKPLTAEELECCYAVGHYETTYRESYPLLAARGERLGEQGVNYIDLNGIFADNHETLYRDICCHFNERGNELLAAAIVERLAPALRRAATAARPDSALAAARDAREELLIDGDFRVYRRAGHWLLYGKEDCSVEDTAAGFFLHITPANAADLPAGRREYGFENRDFEFGETGSRFDGRCVAEQRLPHYAIASIRTGQLSGDGAILWAGEYHFPRQE